MSRRVAVIAPSPVPYTIGGAEKLWWGLLQAFRRRIAWDAANLSCNVLEKLLA